MAQQVIGRAGHCKVIAVAGHYLVNLVEDMVGIGFWREGRIGLGEFLWQIGHHDGSIEHALCHLMQVYKDATIACGEVDALRKEHGCVAVGVEGDGVVMCALHLAEEASLRNQPLEQWQTVFAHTFRMPLHADDGFVFTALYSFDDAVGRCGYGAKMWTRLTDSLMVEGVDVE